MCTLMRCAEGRTRFCNTTMRCLAHTHTDTCTLRCIFSDLAPGCAPPRTPHNTLRLPPLPCRCDRPPWWPVRTRNINRGQRGTHSSALPALLPDHRAGHRRQGDHGAGLAPEAGPCGCSCWKGVRGAAHGESHVSRPGGNKYINGTWCVALGFRGDYSYM